MKAAILCVAAIVLAPALFSQEPCADRVRALERQLNEQNHLLRDWGGLIRYGSENSELPAAAKGRNRVIVFGDQIAEQWSLPANAARGLEMINRGIAGQTTDQMLVRFRQDVIALRPQAVVILAGANDIAGIHGSHTEEMILDNLMSMTELARAHNIRVILASVPSSRRQSEERISELNNLIAEYCARGSAVYLENGSSAEKAFTEVLR